MKIFIALLVATLAIAAETSSYAEPAWPVGTVGLNSWNNYGLTSYQDGVNQWTPVTWPVVTYGGRKTSVEPNVAKVNPWGIPTVAYDYGYNSYLGAIPTVGNKYVAPVSGLVHQAPLVGYGVNQKVIVAGHGYGF